MKKFLPVLFFILFFSLATEVKALSDPNILPPPNLTCDPKNVQDTTSRPAEFQPCNQTSLYSVSCATTTTASQDVSFRRGDGSGESPHCLNQPWGGTVTIDPSKVTIPFVGSKGNESEEKYLADYFEGTHEYYRNYEGVPGLWYGTNTNLLPNYQGILRKLTPMEYQNQLKKQMVQRAQDSLTSGAILQEGKIHDYKIKYLGRLCWEAPLWAKTLVAVASRLRLPASQQLAEITNYCLFSVSAISPFDDLLISDVHNFLDNSLIKIPHWYENGVEGKLSDLIENLPPEPTDPDYQKNWEEWKKSEGGKWFKLWQATMMVTREDTPGYIIPYLGWRPEDTPMPLDKDIAINQEIEKVPHLARLYEASGLVQQILIPFGLETSSVQETAPPVDPIQTTSTCGLADPIPVGACTNSALVDTNPNDKLCDPTCQPMSVKFTAVDAFENPEYEACRAEGIQCGDPYPCLVPPTFQCYDCHDPCDDLTKKTLERKIGLRLDHPYLDQIWDQIANAQTGGVFNIFRPQQIPPSPDLDAASILPIQYSGNDGVNVNPKEGKFYFSHLGGIQIGKGWLNGALTPWK